MMPSSEITATSRRPQPPIEIGTSATLIMTVNRIAASETGSSRPCARPATK